MGSHIFLLNYLPPEDTLRKPEEGLKMSGGFAKSITCSLLSNQRLHTYIVTSKPKRISVAAGDVHILILLKIN